MKRYSNRWMASFSYAYNDAVERWGSPASYEDPTNIEQSDGGQFAPESGGSGIDNVFTNAKWLVKMSGQYTLPWWDINLAGFYNVRQGYPFPQAVLTPSRANRAGTANVLLDTLGDVRLPNMYTLDFRVDKVFAFGPMRVVPSMDIFNLTNVNTVLDVSAHPERLECEQPQRHRGAAGDPVRRARERRERWCRWARRRFGDR